MKRIYIYLLIFSVLINLYLIVNDGKVLKQKEVEIEQFNQKLKIKKDSIELLKSQLKQQTQLQNHV